jgi:Thiol-disulfide isomerase and thioredoxins
MTPAPRPGQPRRRLVFVVGAALAAVILVVGFAVLSGDNDVEPRGTTAVEAASTAPSVPSTSFEMLDGSSGSFAAYRGRPLVVNFFASWCTPCLAELPGFERVHQELNQQVAFLGLNLQDRPADGRWVVEETGITYDVGRDPSGELFRTLRGVAMPTTVFVDAQGRVVDVHSGELSAGALKSKIEGLLLS